MTGGGLGWFPGGSENTSAPLFQRDEVFSAPRVAKAKPKI